MSVWLLLLLTDFCRLFIAPEQFLSRFENPSGKIEVFLATPWKDDQAHKF